MWWTIKQQNSTFFSLTSGNLWIAYLCNASTSLTGRRSTDKLQSLHSNPQRFQTDSKTHLSMQVSATCNQRSLAWSMPQYHSTSCLMNINNHFQPAINRPISLTAHYKNKENLWSRHCIGSCDVPPKLLGHAANWVYETGSLNGWQQGSTLRSRSSAYKQISTWLAIGVLRPERYWALDKARHLLW